MKRFSYFLFFLLLAACNNNGKENATDDDTTAANTPGIQNVNGNVPDTTNAITIDKDTAGKKDSMRR
ncbi:MAG: hypothetical protein ICV66_03725 [Chitinophagaceae bacterium]|nr:hypothetical protein [Chitinophagaceae bacterium]